MEFLADKFLHRNASKAICHLACVPGNDVRKCTGSIPAEHKKVILERNAMRENKKRNNKLARNELTKNTIRTQTSIVSGFHAQASRARTVSSTNTVNTNATLFRDKACNISVAELVYTKGLNFSIPESPQFRAMLNAARYVSKNYVPPTKKDLSGDLLDICYKKRIEEYKENLHQEAARFGISFYGDRATVRKKDTIQLQVVAEIHDALRREESTEKTNADETALEPSTTNSKNQA